MSEEDKKRAVATVGDALDRIMTEWEKSALLKELLQRFPLVRVSADHYGDAYFEMMKHQSPACTDGEKVYVSAEMMAEFLAQEFHRYERPENMPAIDGDNPVWAYMPTGEVLHLNVLNYYGEIETILLHEMTHAFYGHSKLQMAARNRSRDYQKKLEIACEIQANNGVFGESPAGYVTQGLRGVTNKRWHPETLGSHSLSDIIKALRLNDNERRDAKSGTKSEQAQAADNVSKMTGAAERAQKQIDDGDMEELPEEGNTFGDKQTASDVAHAANSEIFERNLKNVKELIVEALSDNLTYDADTDSVVRADRVYRENVRSYTRVNPTYVGTPFVKRGRKIQRHFEPEHANKLVVLAVDKSGSMDGVQKYVASITDKLLRDIKKAATESNIDVDYDKFLGVVFDYDCSDPISVNSDEWRRWMANLQADGGTNFPSVIRRVEALQEAASTKYSDVTVICVGDGEGAIAEGEYIEQSALTEFPISDVKSFKWIDAIIAEKADESSVNYAMKWDRYRDMRRKVVIA